MTENKNPPVKVPVYDENERVIAMVNYTENLDMWNGHDWTNGGAGHHLGLTKLKSGKYVLVHGTNWEGESDHGEIISPEAALDHILRAGSLDLLEMKKFSDLKTLMGTKLEQEMDDE